MSVRVIVADDERLARQRLVRLLAELGDVEVVAECADGASTIEAIRAHHPAVLFLDIEMPEGGGFDVARAIGAEQSGRGAPLIVFVTAFDQYAVQAFDIHAADYIMKPFGAERLALTWTRVRQELARGTRTAPDIERLLTAIEDLRKSRTPYRDRLLVTADGRTTIIRMTDVEWIEAAANYVRLHVGKSRHLLREPLSTLEAQLDPSRFARVHRSAIVNLDFVHEIQPWFSGDQVIILKSGDRVKLSRTHRRALEEQLSGKVNAP